MKGHNYDHGKGDICKKCGKVHISGRLDKSSWNKGLTKETDERVMKYAKDLLGHFGWMNGHIPWNKGKKGYIPWNKGLTKKTDERIVKQAKKHSVTLRSPNYKPGNLWRKGRTAWNKGLTKETDERVKKYADATLGHKPRGTNFRFIDRLGHGVRSSWEMEFAFMLKNIGVSYIYESTAFEVLINGRIHKYHPDFEVRKDYFIEIKGFVRLVEILKLNAFINQYPHIKLVILGLDNHIERKELQCRVVPWARRATLVEELKCL